MYIKDEVLDKLLEPFHLNDQDRLSIIEDFRAVQIELMLKNFLVYYETHKSEIELRYLDQLAEGIKNQPSIYIKKFVTLFSAEIDKNPEVITFIQTKMSRFLSEVIRTYTRGRTEEEIRAVVETMFEDMDLIEMLNASQPQNSPRQ